MDYEKIYTNFNDYKSSDSYKLIVTELTNCRTFIGRKRFLDNLVKNNKLEYISSGSARLVYGQSNFVIKLAKNAKGLVQNEVEASSGAGTFETRVAETYDFAKDYTWILSERCSKITLSEFKKLENMTFTYFCNCLSYYYYNNIKTSFIRPPKPDGYDSTWNNDTLLNSMYDYIGNFQVPVGDLLRISSYGKSSDGDIKLIDYGFNEDTAKLYN